MLPTKDYLDLKMMCEQSTAHPFETFFAIGHTYVFFKI